MYKLIAVWLLATTSPFVDVQPTVSNSTTTTSVFVDSYEYLDVPADVAENCWEDQGACS